MKNYLKLLTFLALSTLIVPVVHAQSTTSVMATEILGTDKVKAKAAIRAALLAKGVNVDTATPAEIQAALAQIIIEISPASASATDMTSTMNIVSETIVEVMTDVAIASGSTNIAASVKAASGIAKGAVKTAVASPVIASKVTPGQSIAAVNAGVSRGAGAAARRTGTAEATILAEVNTDTELDATSQLAATPPPAAPVVIVDSAPPVEPIVVAPIPPVDDTEDDVVSPANQG
jgi:hypothetical protein